MPQKIEQASPEELLAAAEFDAAQAALATKESLTPADLLPGDKPIDEQPTSIQNQAKAADSLEKDESLPAVEKAESIGSYFRFALGLTQEREHELAHELIAPYESYRVETGDRVVTDDEVVSMINSYLTGRGYAVKFNDGVWFSGVKTTEAGPEEYRGRITNNSRRPNGETVGAKGKFGADRLIISVIHRGRPLT